MDMKYPVLMITSLFTLAAAASGQDTGRPQFDEFSFDNQKLIIHFFGHASLMLDFNGVLIYVDPVSAYLSAANAPKADIILVTHEHGDHLDPALIAGISKNGTRILANQAVIDQLKKGTAMKNGDSAMVEGIPIQAVPAYNTTRGRERFHPEGHGNGYVLTLGKKRVYIAGDTEDIPEMSALKNIDIAFLPVNQPYTMTPAQAARALSVIKPQIFYPYHLGSTDTKEIEKLLKNVKGVELRLRDLQ
jgi:L-ascorbate metabolism protein UlaG (beta-lactamase superfamily)